MSHPLHPDVWPLTVDQGTLFGTWEDPTSRLIYHDAMGALLSGIERPHRVLDLGGGNGLAREWFPGAVTVDVDPTKEPDVVANVLDYTPDQTYELVLIRYVLHYLPDALVVDLLDHVATYHDGPVVIIQFVNDDLAVKSANSVGELKCFRTEEHLRSLTDRDPWELVRRIAVSYDVEPDFYRHRLGHPHPTGHPETVVSYLLERS